MKIKKWLKYTLVIFIILAFVSTHLFNRSGLMIYGGLTQRVDPAQFEPQTGAFAITNVHVLSPDGETFIPGQTVLLKDGLIEAIDSTLSYSDQLTAIDGTGKYLIPGLTDAHVHLFKSPNDLLLYVANGVTQIRELIGEPDHLQWRGEIEQGRVGPELFVATPRLGTFEPMEGWFMEKTQGFLNIEDAETARQMVKELHEQGYDGVKLYSHLSKESYQAIIQAATELNMPTFGHVPWALSLEEVCHSGQSGIAHFEELMNALNREFGEKTFGNFYDKEEEFLAYVEERSPTVVQDLLDNNIAVTSTLWLVESFVRQKFELDQVLREVELAYENPGISEWATYIPGGLGWLPEVNRYKVSGDPTEEELDERRKYWSAYAKACQLLAKKLHQGGVPIMAGTDANLPPTVPGFSLHDELVSLCNVGLSNAEVIRTATTNPSAWLNKKTGQLSPGYRANLVLLDENPLVDIRHTRAINAVFLQGRMLDRALLDEMLAAVKEANDQSRKVDISAYED